MSMSEIVGIVLGVLSVVFAVISWIYPNIPRRDKWVITISSLSVGIACFFLLTLHPMLFPRDPSDPSRNTGNRFFSDGDNVYIETVNINSGEQTSPTLPTASSPPTPTPTPPPTPAPTPPPTPSPTPSPTPTPPPTPSPTPVTVTVRVRDQQRLYDGKPQRLDQNAYTVEGMRDGDTLNVKLYIEDSGRQTLEEVTDAGSYTISAETGSYDSQKYKVTVYAGTLTVKPAELSITASSDSKTWDGTSLVQTNSKPDGLLDGHSFRVQFSVIDSDGNWLSAWPTEVGIYTKRVTEVHIVDGNGREVTDNYHITRIDGTITIKPTPTPPPTSKPTTKSTSTPTPKPSYPGTAWTPPDGSSPSRQDLDSVKNNKKYPNNIVYPQSSSYLSTYEVMYVKSGLGHSIYLFWDPKCTMDTKRNHYVYEGDAVTVIAREGSASCIIYMNPEGHAISGWVDSGFLVY